MTDLTAWPPRFVTVANRTIYHVLNASGGKLRFNYCTDPAEVEHEQPLRTSHFDIRRLPPHLLTDQTIERPWPDGELSAEESAIRERGAHREVCIRAIFSGTPFHDRERTERAERMAALRVADMTVRRRA